MIQVKPKLMTFEDFLDWKPDSSRYELHDEFVVEIQPVGKHEQIKIFLTRKFFAEIMRSELSWSTANQVLVKAPDKEAGYVPDILIINPDNLATENLWEKSSTVQKAATIPLIVEVVSTNWSDDYALKLDAYQEIGVREYWIVDYLGLGGKHFIGNLK